jgi:hypothetical protein
MITAIQFLTVLEDKDLLPKELMFDLYKLVAQSNQVTADDIAAMLVKDGHLTQIIANRLLGVAEKPGNSAITSLPTYTEVKKAEVKKEDSSLEIAVDQSDAHDLDFAPLKEEREPRPVLGKHKPYRVSDSTQNIQATPLVVQTAKPQAASLPKAVPLDQPGQGQSRWATSMYDREIDTSKGIVSPTLVKMAGVEKIPQDLHLRSSRKWMTRLVRLGFILGFAVLFYLIIDWIFFKK